MSKEIGHHPWCNFQSGPVDYCKQCARLWVQYPEASIQKYFPDAVVRHNA